jgi:hypothetical protein
VTAGEPCPLNPRLEGLRLAVELYARRTDVTGEIVLHAAGFFSEWLESLPVLPPVTGAQILEALETVIAKQEETMTALTDLQAADSALQAEVATFLADIAAKLSESDPDIESVVADINAQVASLQSSDPANAAPVTPPVTPPAVSN